jgi:hypothetical protein
MSNIGEKPAVVATSTKWGSDQNQRLLLNLGLKMNVGLIGSGILSMLIFKRAGSRAFLTGIGGGSGFGYAWCQNDFYLKDPKINDALIPKSIEGEFQKYWSKVNGLVPDFAKFK